MAETTVERGQTVNGVVLDRGDYQHVEGTANDTVIQGGGGQLVYLGTTNHSVVNAGAYQVVTDGTVNATVVNAGGDLTLYDGATANDALINGGNQTLLAPTAIANATIVNGGSQAIYAGKAVGTIVGSNGSQFAEANTVNHAPPVVSGTTVTGGGTQQIDLSQGFVDVSGTRLLAGGRILLSGFGENGNTVVTFDQASDVLTFRSDANVFTMQLAGNYTVSSFGISSNGSFTTVTALCFCRGTGIRTPRGDIAIEQLRVGDEVTMRSGTARPVRWIGASTAIVTDETRPVIVRAGAFPDGTPYRDLRVTHLHSFLFGDVLIPIGDLMNGDSIAKDGAARIAEVYHLAFDVHDIVLAEGAPAESYRDDGNRIGFAAESGDTCPARAMPTCAPVVRGGPIVDRTRRRLAAFAANRRPAQSPTVRGSELVSNSIS